MDEAFTRALSHIDDLARGGRNALPVIAEALQKLPRYTGVYFYELQGDTLHLRAHAGRATEHREIPVGRGLCGLSARTGDTVVVDDVTNDSQYLACNVETRSEIVVPITVDGKYVAQIDIDSDFPAAFGATDREFLSRVAAALAPVFAATGS
jgi:L-methionine (R)-S-oxide reductase